MSQIAEGVPDECAGCPRCLQHVEKELEQFKTDGLVGAAIAHAAEALQIAIRLGRAEKEIEQLKSSNEWLLKQLKAKEPWVSVDRDTAKEQAALKKSSGSLDWSVRAHRRYRGSFFDCASFLMHVGQTCSPRACAAAMRW